MCSEGGTLPQPLQERRGGKMCINMSDKGGTDGLQEVGG